MSAKQDFWSRRRAGVAAEAEVEQAAFEAQAIADEQAALKTRSDSEILAELDLPDPDSLQAGDDFAAFMAKAVPDRIRRRALRKLWRTNPVLANIDQLVDYGEDFTDGANVVENLQTTYQVGKGMLKHVEEMARQAEANVLDMDEEPVMTEGEEPAMEDEPAVASAPDPGPEDTIAEAVMDEDDCAPQPALRRMKFRFEETA